MLVKRLSELSMMIGSSNRMVSLAVLKVILPITPPQSECKS